MATDFIIELYQEFLKKKGTVNMEVFRRYLQIKHHVKITPTTLSDHLNK
jgi:hypothetical protein